MKRFILKRFLPLILLVSCVLPAAAEFRFGPMVGVNGSSLFWKQDLVSTHYRIGGSAGIIGEVMIPGIGFGVDIGLRYQLNGAHVGFGEREIWAGPPDYLKDSDVWIHTLQIPLNLRFKYTRLYGLERIVAPFAFAGPVFTFNLATNDVPAIQKPGGTVDVQIGAGAELWEHLQVSGGYYWGVSYQVKTIKLDNFSARPQGWFVNVAYLF